MARCIVRCLRDTSAAAAAEFALVVPVFFVLVFGTINAGIALSAVSQMHYAAERSARCLAVDITTPCSKADIDTYAKTFYQGPAISDLTFTSPTPDPACGRQVTGTANYEILAGMASTALTISAKACYPVI